MTGKCIDIAIDNNCFLSFTGFANGAWLAEHSLYFAHKCFKHLKSKAVLFDSPGMVKSEQKLESTGIINKEKKFSLKDMNVVNYLTAPCFANSCNQHVGIVYRLFVNEENFLLDLEDQFKEKLKDVPVLGWLVENISDSLKNYKFFLVGLATMFNHSKKIDLIVKEFNGGSNGRPNYCERVEEWPVLQMSFDKSYGKTISNNINELTSEKVKSVIGKVPDK